MSSNLRHLNRAHHRITNICSLQGTDIDVAGEFIVMAANLLHQGRSCFGRSAAAGGSEEDDSRWELIRQVINTKS